MPSPDGHPFHIRGQPVSDLIDPIPDLQELQIHIRAMLELEAQVRPAAR